MSEGVCVRVCLHVCVPVVLSLTFDLCRGTYLIKAVQQTSRGMCVSGVSVRMSL